tara:strand:+ start:4942 stop:5883 length:942 start_codon:yes stop_codon:yes gene_type:complete
MKKLIFIFSVAISLGAIIQSCRDDDAFQEVISLVIEGNLFFANQSDFEEFQENGYTKVIGNVTILDNVTSLLPLSTLNIVQGNILIKNTQLLTLNGLENLISIAGDLSITSDLVQNMPIQNIENFCALQNLFNQGMFGSVTITDNGFNPTVQDIINGNCIAEQASFDCPEIEANFGDMCTDAEGDEGAVSENCECIVAQACDYQGVSLFEINGNTGTETLIAESDLFTDFFYTSSNGPEVEIFALDNPGNFNFTTTVVTLNATGTGILNYNGTTYTVNVTCLKTGNAIGQEMRFDITSPEVEAEICVIIDNFQ